MTQQPDHYLMEDPREAQRLIDKVDAGPWVSTYLVPYLNEDARVLDVGSGPGAIAAHVARHLPDGKVTGLDASVERLRHAQTLLGTVPNASMVCGTAAALPFPDAAFDVAFTRFLLEYTPAPDRIVAEMARVCRPGGVVLLQDLDGQLIQHHPPDPVLQDQLDAVLAGLAATGFDIHIGRKLFGLARAAGLRVCGVRVEAYHLIAGRISEPDRRLWELKLDIGRTATARVLGTAAQAAMLKDRFLAYLDRDDTVTWSLLFSVWATKE
jgi:SAM-dependent methyltransferase